MSVRAGIPASPFTILPSDEWRLVPLHWHAFARLTPASRAPEAALFNPAAVATWVAAHSEAYLWQQHYLIASRGDSIRHDGLLVSAVLNEKCAHGCVGTYLASGRRP